MTILGKTIIAILFIGVVGGGAYYATNFMKNDASKVQEEATTKTASDVEIQNTAESDIEVEGKTFTEKDMSFQELMKKTGSYVCTVKQNVAGISTEGKVSIKGENISATFSTSVQGRTIETSTITKDGYVYTWSNVTPTSGVKTKIQASVQPNANTNAPTSASYAWDGKDIGSYSCVVANIPSTAFDLPSAVTFLEINK